MPYTLPRHLFPARMSSWNASCGTSTLPSRRMRRFPSFCFSSSLRLLVPGVGCGWEGGGTGGELVGRLESLPPPPRPRTHPHRDTSPP